MTTIQLTDIAFPVYPLGKNKPIESEGVTLYYFEEESISEDEEGNAITTYSITVKVVDDKTLKGATLAHRRLRLKMDEIPLYKLKNALFFLGDFIKVAKPNIWFIDSTGKVFKYSKNTVAKLKWYKISNVIDIPTGGAIIELLGSLTRFKSLFPPDDGQEYAALLEFGKSQVLYGFYDKMHKTSWRKV